MILWNVSSKKIEARYDGKVFEFAPNERKRILDLNIVNHLIFKLKSKGLAAIDEEERTPDNEKKSLIDALKERRRSLDFVVRNYRTMNKEREAQKLSAEAPSEAVIDAVEEIQEIDDQLKELLGDRLKKVEKYLNDNRSKEAQEEIENSEQLVETKGSFETEIREKRPGRPRKNAVSPAGNP